jgi:hypothetical protein
MIFQASFRSSPPAQQHRARGTMKHMAAVRVTATLCHARTAVVVVEPASNYAGAVALDKHARQASVSGHDAVCVCALQ